MRARSLGGETLQDALMMAGGAVYDLELAGNVGNDPLGRPDSHHYFALPAQLVGIGAQPEPPTQCPSR
jgi:hypothetical protein